MAPPLRWAFSQFRRHTTGMHPKPRTIKCSLSLLDYTPSLHDEVKAWSLSSEELTAAAITATAHLSRGKNLSGLQNAVLQEFSRRFAKVKLRALHNPPKDSP